MRWLSIVLAGLAATAQAAPSATSDRAVDTPVTTRALGDQDEVTIAYGGSGASATYLAVWREVVPPGNTTIYAARMSAAGVVRDDPPIVIATGASTANPVALPAVAFDGVRFLVVWVEHSTPFRIRGAYVDLSGNTTMPFPVSPPTLNGAVNKPSVAGGNGHALVVWNDGRASPAALRGALLDDTGLVTGKSDLALSQSNDPVDSGAVVWGGPTANNFMVAWAQGITGLPQVFGTFVDATGAVSPAMPFQISTTGAGIADAFDPAIATDGTQYLVVWPDDRNDPTMSTIDIWGRFVPFTTAPTASDFLVAPAPANEFYRPVQATFAAASSRWMLVWQHGNGGPEELFGQRRTSSGALEAAGSPISTTGTSNTPLLPDVGIPQTAIATDGTKAFAAWTLQARGTLLGVDAYAQPIDVGAASLTPTAPVLLSRGRNYQIGRSVATNGSVALIVWVDDRNLDTTGLDIYGLRVGIDGTPIDAQPFPISTAASDQFAPYVAVAPGGDTFLVAWADARNPSPQAPVQIFGARVPAQGNTFPDGNGFQIRSNTAQYAGLRPTVAAGQNGWLVAWEDWRSSPFPNQAPEIWAAQVSLTSQVGGEIRITSLSAEAPACEPAATFDGQQYFVAFEQPCSLPYTAKLSNPNVSAQWIKTDGNLGPRVILANTSDPDTAPAVASDRQGKVYAVWTSGVGNVVAAAFTDGATTPSATPGTVFANGSVPPSAPAIAAAGDAVLVSFVDASGAHLLRTDATLKVIDVDGGGQPAPFDVLAGQAFRASPRTDATYSETGRQLASIELVTPAMAMAALPTGEAIVAYDALETLSGKATSRVHYRKLGVLPRGAACSSVSGCGDAFCSGGFCCDTQCDGICQRCGANGCVEAAQSDDRCGSDGGTISCAALDTTCRTYRDVPNNRCEAFGVCAESGSPAVCTDFTDAPDGTACMSAAAGQLVAGTCRAGACDVPYSPPQFALRTPVGGCALSGRAPVAAPLALVLLALLAITWRRSRAR